MSGLPGVCAVDKMREFREDIILTRQDHERTFREAMDLNLQLIRCCLRGTGQMRSDICKPVRRSCKGISQQL